jgi:3D (Asp-Asp-Asp) domain-containing protein
MKLKMNCSDNVARYFCLGLLVITLTVGGSMADAGADRSSDDEAVFEQATVNSAAAPARPVVKSDPVEFEATAYCIRGRTASGVPAQAGVIAADTRLLPIGTVVHIQAGKYSGTYTVLDTGARLKGRRVDIFVPTRREAIRFGRRPIKLKILGRIHPSPDCSGLVCAQP